MPLRKQGTLVKGIAVLFASGAAAVAAPAGASAAATATTPSTIPTASCVQQPTTKAFASVGDNADYSLAPGGDFESSAGWTFTGGAKIASGNENVGITSGGKSLQLPFGSVAVSPSFCVDESNPYFRFVAKPDNALAGYAAVVFYKNAAGKVTQAQFTSSADASWGAGKWAVSKVSPLATKIPLATGATASVQIAFVSTGNLASAISLWGAFAGGSVGTTSIDSLEIDPYRRG
ncbi:MAG: hypothetical protein REI11_01620 [Patulibacter sp.]|nr:hypothetical protein [Patulibacter sp.]